MVKPLAGQKRLRHIRERGRARIDRATGYGCASADLRSFTIDRAPRSRQRVEQAFTARGNLRDREVEGLLVGLRRAMIPTDLSYKL